MKRTILVFMVCTFQICYGQDKDRKVIFELKTKCMELARDYCREASSGGSFYDVKHNRCFAICTRIGSGFISTSLDDVHTGMNLAISYFGTVDSTGTKIDSWGVIRDEMTTYDKAMKYIKKMTTEPDN